MTLTINIADVTYKIKYFYHLQSAFVLYCVSICRCSIDQECIAHVYNKLLKHCGLIYRSNDGNQFSASESIGIFVKGEIPQENFFF